MMLLVFKINTNITLPGSECRDESSNSCLAILSFFKKLKYTYFFIKNRSKQFFLF